MADWHVPIEFVKTICLIAMSRGIKLYRKWYYRSQNYWCLRRYVISISEILRTTQISTIVKNFIISQKNPSFSHKTSVMSAKIETFWGWQRENKAIKFRHCALNSNFAFPIQSTVSIWLFESYKVGFFSLEKKIPINFSRKNQKKNSPASFQETTYQFFIFFSRSFYFICKWNEFSFPVSHNRSFF